MKDKKSLKNLMRREGREGREVAGTPRVVHSARSHQTVTDTERLQERNVRRGGKVRMREPYTVHCTQSIVYTSLPAHSSFKLNLLFSISFGEIVGLEKTTVPTGL